MMDIEQPTDEPTARHELLHKAQQWHADRLALASEAGLFELGLEGAIPDDPRETNETFERVNRETLDVALAYAASGAEQNTKIKNSIIDRSAVWFPQDSPGAIATKSLNDISTLLNKHIDIDIANLNYRHKFLRVAATKTESLNDPNLPIKKEVITELAEDLYHLKPTGIRYDKLADRELFGGHVKGPITPKVILDIKDTETLARAVIGLKHIVKDAYLERELPNIRLDERNAEVNRIIESGEAIGPKLSEVERKLAALEEADPLGFLKPGSREAGRASPENTPDGEREAKRQRTEMRQDGNAGFDVSAALANLPSRAALLQADRPREERGL